MAGAVDGDGRRWDERHASTPVDRVAPPTALAGVDVALGRGRALDVACGKGGTAVWAAQVGMDVVALDVSPVATDASRALATAHGVRDRVDARVHDLVRGLPPQLGSFDLIVCQRYRDPALWPALVDHLRADGVVAVTVLSTVGAERPGRFHAAPGELTSAFSHLGVDVIRSAEGSGEASVVAVRPTPTPVGRVAAMDDKLRSVLDELQSAIRRAEADGVIDDDERVELRTLTGQLDDLLAGPGQNGGDDGLTEQLQESAIRFEGNHPTLAAAIRSAVDTLTGYGM